MLANIMERNRAPISEDIFESLFSKDSALCNKSIPRVRNKSASGCRPSPRHAKLDTWFGEVCKVEAPADIVVDNASQGDQCDKGTLTTNRAVVAAAAPAVVGVGIKIQEPPTTASKIEIPVAKFLSTTRTDGRPMRNRFPVLQHWRNERMVYERPHNSALPVIASVEFTAPDTFSASVKRRRGCLARSFQTREETESVAAPVQDESLIESSRFGGTQEKECMPNMSHNLCVNSNYPIDVKEEVLSVSAQPSRSALKRSADRKEFQNSDQHDRTQYPTCKSISFVEGPTTKSIKNFKSEDLWYPGFMVHCDGCGQFVKWGAEGIMTGSPGRSRFMQWQVLCNTCLTKKIYGELGVWFIIALASGEEGGSHIASQPVSKLLKSLLRVNPNLKSDQLVEFLGKESELPEVRNAVLQNAVSGVRFLIGKPKKLDLKENDSKCKRRRLDEDESKTKLQELQF